jgi:hypothetical protein
MEPETMPDNAKSNAVAGPAWRVVALVLALGMSLSLAPRVTDASSSKEPTGTDKYMLFEFDDARYTLVYPDLSYTLQGGAPTACIAGSKRHVGDKMTLRVCLKSTGAQLAQASVTLTDSDSSVYLGRGNGMDFTAHVNFWKDTPACGSTWSDKHSVWVFQVTEELTGGGSGH